VSYRFVAPGLDQPGQVDDRVDASEQLGQIVASDVGADECGPRERALGAAPGQPDDLLHRRLVGQRLEHARADVSGGAGDENAHAWGLPPG
jgi:hypothetical protein